MSDLRYFEARQRFLFTAFVSQALAAKKLKPDIDYETSQTSPLNVYIPYQSLGRQQVNRTFSQSHIWKNAEPFPSEFSTECVITPQ